MRISACYIVKDEAARLSRSLASLTGAVDEIVVVDSGSTDDTVKIAVEFGAQVFQFPWCDDFSATRNFSLSKATGDWVLVVDADEYFPDGMAGNIRRVVEQYGKDADLLMFLRRELDALGIPDLQLRDLTIPQEQGKDILLALYATMIEQIENDACYYACMTFGTKTYPLVLFSVLSFADKLRDNVSIKGIYYQEILRENGAAQDARLYDVSTLFTLNSIVDTVAEMDGNNKVAMIRRLLEC